MRETLEYSVHTAAICSFFTSLVYNLWLFKIIHLYELFTAERFCALNHSGDNVLYYVILCIHCTIFWYLIDYQII